MQYQLTVWHSAIRELERANRRAEFEQQNWKVRVDQVGHRLETEDLSPWDRQKLDIVRDSLQAEIQMSKERMADRKREMAGLKACIEEHLC